MRHILRNLVLLLSVPTFFGCGSHHVALSSLSTPITANGFLQSPATASDDGSVTGSQASVQGSSQNKIFITRLYQWLLGRDPETAGFNFWLNAASSGNISCSQLAVSFLDSSEFAIDASTLTDAAFVKSLYLGLLGHYYEPAGFNFWMGALNSGVSRSSVAKGFLSSTEFNRLCSSTYGFSDGAGRYELTQEIQAYNAALPANGIRLHVQSTAQNEFIFSNVANGQILAVINQDSLKPLKIYIGPSDGSVPGTSGQVVISKMGAFMGDYLSGGLGTFLSAYNGAHTAAGVFLNVGVIGVTVTQGITGTVGDVYVSTQIGVTETQLTTYPSSKGQISQYIDIFPSNEVPAGTNKTLVVSEAPGGGSLLYSYP